MNASRIRELRALGRQDEALRLASDLAAALPADAEVQFEAACVHDHLGKEAEAVLYYRAAIANGLTGEHQLQALVQLGSTLRALGKYPDAREVLEQAVAEFPKAPEAKVFLAMALHNCGESKAAVETLLLLLAHTSAAPGVSAYKRAIEFYAQDIERYWP
jgi:tetratricopeptide (TPR) repeat protein